jgi:hypothetical protein
MTTQPEHDFDPERENAPPLVDAPAVFVDAPAYNPESSELGQPEIISTPPLLLEPENPIPIAPAAESQDVSPPVEQLLFQS